MQGLTFYAAIVGGIPVLAFLAALWLSDGAPFTPIGLISESTAVAAQPVAGEPPLAPIALAEP
ncbi:MAG: hypothetical protein ACTSX7_05585 [Alphaproteobacteria bacterium]